MEIEIDKTAINTFEDLKYGDVFVGYLTDDPENNIYLVISRDYGLGIEDEFHGYAAGLKTGEIYGFYNSDPVIKMNAKLTATLPAFK